MPSTHLKNHESSSILLPGTSRTERRLGLDPPTKFEHETPSNIFRPRNCLYPGSIVQLTPNLGSSTCWGSALGIWGLTWWHRLTLLCLDVNLTLSLNIMIPILIMPTRSPTSERLVMNKHNEPFFALHSALTRIFILKNTLFRAADTSPAWDRKPKHLASCPEPYGASNGFWNCFSFPIISNNFPMGQHFQTSDDLHVFSMLHDCTLQVLSYQWCLVPLGSLSHSFSTGLGWGQYSGVHHRTCAGSQCNWQRCWDPSRRMPWQIRDIGEWVQGTF